MVGSFAAFDSSCDEVLSCSVMRFVLVRRVSGIVSETRIVINSIAWPTQIAIHGPFDIIQAPSSGQRYRDQGAAAKPNENCKSTTISTNVSNIVRSYFLTCLASSVAISVTMANNMEEATDLDLPDGHA